MSKIGIAGNYDTDVRSDCQVVFELTDTGGQIIDLQSKLKVLFGKAITSLAFEMLNFYEIKNCKLTILDKGALDFILAARIEAAIKLVIETEKEFLLPFLPENNYKTEKDQFRLSRLYLPGNTPKLAINAGVHKPHGIILDLEDAVAPAKKYEARFLVRNALRNLDFYGAERMVRINQIPVGLDDLKFIVQHNVNLILIPKCENAEQVKLVDIEIEKITGTKDNKIWYMPIIESALGIENAFSIATASPNVVSLAIGLEDFTADLGVKRTAEGTESYFARTRIVNACKAAGIQPIDSVFSDVADMEALRKNVEVSKSLGFEGMGCIHPRQIQVIHNAFMPSKDEIEKAQKIVEAFNEAQEKGLGVVSLGTKMIDAPVVKRAFQTLNKIKNV